ncbi:MAG: flagellar basal-body MS-ring/collar protein FliF [Opitutales bacterium]|nr:flagellar basal-body MS-ring/collar protein FliF [Opitutales bacterium]
MKERFSKLAELWDGLNSSRKLTLVVALGGILILSVGILSWSGGSTSMRVLVSGADADDLSDVVDVLRSNQVEFEYSESGDTILVPEDKRAAMRMELAMKGLPRSGDVGFEIFDEGNFGISDFVQRTNHTRAIQGELQRTIAMMDSIKSAKVFIVKPENNLLLSEDPNDRPSASVYVDTGGSTLDKANVNAIQFLVSNANKGINKSNVAVMDNQGNLLSEQGESSGAAGVAGQMMKAYEAQERRLETKIETMLAKTVGRQNVIARVSVNLDTKSMTELDEKFDPDGQVPRTSTTDKDMATTVETQPQNNATGMGANVPNVSQDATQQDPMMAKSDESRESKTTDFEISRNLKETVQEPGSIISRSVAVLIAKGESPRTAEDIDVIREAVINAVGARFNLEESELLTHVSVKEVVFQDPAIGGIGGETLDQFQNFVDKYGPHVKTLVGVILAIALFIVFITMLKRFKPNEAEVQVLDEDDQQLLAGTRSLGSGLTPELLNDLIQEKPDNVGTALRRYLETGSSS